MIIFGTGSLFGRVSKSRSLALLERCVDLGVTHFDTAPSYTGGNSERQVAAFARDHDVSFTTKVGLSAASTPMRLVGLLAAHTGSALPITLRADLKKRAAPSSEAPDREVWIRRMRFVESHRDNLDALLLHEVPTEAWPRWVQLSETPGSPAAVSLGVGTSRQWDPGLADDVTGTRGITILQAASPLWRGALPETTANVRLRLHGVFGVAGRRTEEVLVRLKGQTFGDDTIRTTADCYRLLARAHACLTPDMDLVFTSTDLHRLSDTHDWLTAPLTHDDLTVMLQSLAQDTDD